MRQLGIIYDDTKVLTPQKMDISAPGNSAFAGGLNKITLLSAGSLPLAPDTPADIQLAAPTGEALIISREGRFISAFEDSPLDNLRLKLPLHFAASVKPGKVIVTVPGESLAGAVMACGASTGAETDKVAANNIEMMAVEGSDIQIPADTRLAMVATLQQSVEVGDHILHICQVDKFLGDEDKKGLYAWNGFGKVAPAAEG